MKPGAFDYVVCPPNDAKAQEWVTALSAADIEYELVHGDGVWAIRPGPDAADAVRREIETYEIVNRDWPPQVSMPALPVLEKASPLADLAACSLLVLFYVWLGPFVVGSAVLRGGAADASRIVAGEWWRGVTALMIHAGPRHLVGNVLCLWFFAHAVSRLYGVGVGWCLVLCSATAANILLAHICAVRHVGVGASTAVFAAVGILVGHGVVRRIRAVPLHALRWSRAWLPVGGGLALLALLGADPRTDLAAHGAGFAIGMISGSIPACFLLRPASEGAQRVLQLVSLGLVLLAWAAVFETAC